MTNSDRRITEFEKLSLLEKAAFIGGSAIKLVAAGLDLAINRTADMFEDIEQSFNDGLDPNIEEAKILEERESPRTMKSGKSGKSRKSKKSS